MVRFEEEMDLLWRAVGICIAFATYASEPTTVHRMSFRHLWFEEMRWIANPSPLQTYSLPKVANTYGGEGKQTSEGEADLRTTIQMNICLAFISAYD